MPPRFLTPGKPVLGCGSAYPPLVPPLSLGNDVVPSGAGLAPPRMGKATGFQIWGGPRASVWSPAAAGRIAACEPAAR